MPSVPIPLAEVPPAPRQPSPTAFDLIFRYQGSQKVLLLIGCIFSPVGLLLVLGGSVSVFSELTFWKDPIIKNAAVVDLGEFRHKGSLRANVVYQYEHLQQNYTGTSTITLFEEITVAKTQRTVVVEVAQTDPSVSRALDSGSGWLGIFISLFGLPFAFAGIFMFRSAVKSNRAEINAYTNGDPTIAKIVSAGYDTSTKMNGRHPYQIKWEFLVGDRSYEGSISSMSRVALAPFVDAKQLVVLYLKNDPAQNTLFIP